MLYLLVLAGQANKVSHDWLPLLLVTKHSKSLLPGKLFFKKKLLEHEDLFGKTESLPHSKLKKKNKETRHHAILGIKIYKNPARYLEFNASCVDFTKKW